MEFVHSSDIYNTASAEEIVPLLLEFFDPHSVIDVGCGIGTWLSVFKKNGVESVLGIDGDNVNKEQLFSHIKQDEFIEYDLRKPLLIDRKFDLVVSLEVAEHLPEEASDAFIKSLTQLGDIILFSAAIPNQGGDGHVNEQWPSYWQKKFVPDGFEVYDCVRPEIWSNEKVEWWYRQNVFVAVNREVKVSLKGEGIIESLVHPENYVDKAKHILRLKGKINDVGAGRISRQSAIKIALKTFCRNRSLSKLNKLIEDE